MIVVLWTVLLFFSLILIFIGYYLQHFFDEPNYLIIFLGYSFLFILSVSLFTDNIQIPTGYNETISVGSSIIEVVYQDFGSKMIGFVMAAASFIGAFILFMQYRSPPETRGVLDE